MRRGYLIRFIDIGLIILFGFLMISDLKVISQIALPGNEESTEPPDPLEDPPLMMSIVIDAEGSYTVLDLATREPLFASLPNTEALRTVFQQAMDAEAGNIRVVIEPTPLSPMQRLVDVLDLCEAMRIPRDLNTEAALARIRS